LNGLLNNGRLHFTEGFTLSSLCFPSVSSLASTSLWEVGLTSLRSVVSLTHGYHLPCFRVLWMVSCGLQLNGGYLALMTGLSLWPGCLFVEGTLSFTTGLCRRIL
jgi:hypothetical protein